MFRAVNLLLRKEHACSQLEGERGHTSRFLAQNKYLIIDFSY